MTRELAIKILVQTAEVIDKEEYAELIKGEVAAMLYAADVLSKCCCEGCEDDGK
jgi:hypothetical protein